MKIIRTDKLRLVPGGDQSKAATAALDETVRVYRRFVRALSGVILVHWPELGPMTSYDRLRAVEGLMHKTAKRPHPIYGGWFEKNFYKLPSYLRRAAINFVLGQVSSFVTRYYDWQGGPRDTRPPGFNPAMKAWPTFYKKISFNRNPKAPETVSLKLSVGKGEWRWFEFKLEGKAKNLALPGAEELCPSVQQKGKAFLFCCPVEITITSKPVPEGLPVLSLDVGINTFLVGSLVDSDGTVKGRVTVHPAAHLDHVYKLMTQIAQKASCTKTLSHGFCRGLYGRLVGLRTQIARTVARQITDYSVAHGVRVVVMENLKGYRPKGRGRLRAKFHTWLHRALVRQIAANLEKVGSTLHLVSPRGTSKWAYDGSGLVERDKDNYSLCTFPNGRRYNADLNASYNIAARYYARRLPATREGGGFWPSQLLGQKTRMPFVLAHLWHPRGTKSPASGDDAAGAKKLPQCLLA